MTPGEDLPADQEEEPDSASEGATSLKSAEEVAPASGAIRGGNTSPKDPVITQPRSAAARPLVPARRSSRGRRKRETKRGDRCFQLLMACLSCQCSVLLLSLLEGCSSGLHALCSSCCTSAPRREELRRDGSWRSVMPESCCEPEECLEFCLDCCEICHRS